MAQQKAKYNSRLIDVDTLAKIHDVSPETIYAYVKSGDIICEPRAPNGKCLFRLGDALELDFKQLRRKLKSPKS